MIDAVLTPARNVVDFVDYRRQRTLRARTIRPLCRHCGAALSDGESDDDCSSAGQGAATPAQPAARRAFRAD